MGYDTEVGWRVKGEYNRFNFLGDARKLGVSAEYSSDLRRVQGTLLNPALFRIYDRYFDLRAKGGYKEEDFDSYEEHKGYFDMRLSNISGDFTFDVGVGVENIDIYLKSSDPGIIPGSFALTYPYFRMVYDGRDSKLDPKNGVYLSSYIEYGLPIDDDSTNLTIKNLFAEGQDFIKGTILIPKFTFLANVSGKRPGRDRNETLVGGWFSPGFQKLFYAWKGSLTRTQEALPEIY